MTIATGIGGVISVDNVGGTPVDISCDVASWEVNAEASTIDVSAICSTFDDALPGRMGSTVTLNCHYNSATVLTIFGQGIGVARTVSIQPTTDAAIHFGGEFVHFGYRVVDAATGALTVPITMRAAPGSTPAWTGI
jgi:hypothetical protein